MTFAQWVQSRLTAHGFSPGPIDGVVGEQTVRAIKAFEAAHGLPVDGKVDEMVVAALRASSSAISPAQMVQIPNRNQGAPGNDLPLQVQWPRQANVSSFFGPMGLGQTQIEVPFDMVLAWDRSTRLRRMTLHEQVASSALRALTQIAQTYSATERSALGLNLFGGSLNVRNMRGGKAYSMHAWGIAIDFDPERNQLTWKSPRARLSQADAIPFWQAWEAEGWLSLGRARDFDWMHVQAARL